MQPALSTVCSLNASIETIVADYAAGHCNTVELWLGHAENYVENNSVSALKELFLAHNVNVIAASFQGGLFADSEDARIEHLKHFKSRLQMLQATGIPLLIISGDVFSPVEPQGIGTLSRHLADATKMAADYDIQLALEFDSRASFPNNLQSAIALIDDIGLPSLGLCLDWFHWTIGPSKLQDLALLSHDNLSHVQLSDVADVPREMARDSDRILPGEGCSPPKPLIDWLTQIGYSAAVSVELHNPSLWHVPPRQFGEIAITALRKILGQAEM